MKGTQYDFFPRQATTMSIVGGLYVLYNLIYIMWTSTDLISTYDASSCAVSDVWATSSYPWSMALTLY
jgi:hypothetical protein